MNLGGAPVKRGAGKNSSRLDLVKPVFRMRTTTVQLPGRGEYEMPMIDLVDLFNLSADPVDIGARPRRIVHGKVVSERVF